MIKNFVNETSKTLNHLYSLIYRDKFRFMNKLMEGITKYESYIYIDLWYSYIIFYK